MGKAFAFSNQAWGRSSFGPSISAFVYTPAPTTADHVPLVLVAAFDVDPARATEELYCATVTLDALSNGFAYHGEARAFATVGSLNIVGR